jgi:hypothetical protein
MLQEEARDAIVDVDVTTGKAKDRTNTIHNPPVSDSTSHCICTSKFFTVTACIAAYRVGFSYGTCIRV